jgi:5-methylthioadenosine/S-adenosylhomocysteine deaminase
MTQDRQGSELALHIRGGTVLVGEGAEVAARRADVLVEDGTIAAVGVVPKGTARTAKVLDATGRLVIPGLVNGHAHSETFWQKGMFEPEPLELWLLKVVPVLPAPQVTSRMTYLSALLTSVHLLKRGATTVVDHWVDSVPLAVGLDAVLSGHRDSGIRAVVPVDFQDRPFDEELPALAPLLPDEVRGRLRDAAPAGSDYLAMCKQYIEEHGHPDARVRFALGFSAPQRCSDALLGGLAELAATTDALLHGHLLETRAQRAASYYRGTGEVRRMQALGLLGPRVGPRLGLAHCVHLSPEETGLLADGGVTAVHCPVSNLKLGSGIMPLRHLRDAGVNVALGTDGASSNDNLNMFEVMKLAALLHTVGRDEWTGWPTSREVFGLATRNGARLVGAADRLGVIRVGARADLVLLDMDNTTYLPANDVCRQLVFCEDGGNVRTVLVGGEVVVEDGRSTRVDEAEVLAELRDLHEEYLARMAQVGRQSSLLEPYVARMLGQVMPGARNRRPRPGRAPPHALNGRSDATPRG